MNDIDLILEFVKVKRKYASFFEWYKREKSIKELGVVRTLIESVSGSFTAYQNLRPSTNDPPDVLADNTDGALVGFEVRELVDQEAVELNERGTAVYRDWSHSEVVQELHKIVDEKDSKIYSGGPYQKLILVIPTDEPMLIQRELKPVLENHEFGQTRQLHEAYLLFSYDPETKCYPYVQLRLAANQSIKPIAAPSADPA